MRLISDETHRAFVLRIVDSTGFILLYCSRVEWRTQGTFHSVVGVSIIRNDRFEFYVIRIPGYGNPSIWTPEDAHNLQGEEDTMKYIKTHTKAPVPHILHHSTTYDNALGLPCILMEDIRGESAFELWHDGGHDGEQPFWLNADKPSHQVEQKRINFLKSLAATMSTLNKVTFTHIGLATMFATSTTTTTTTTNAASSAPFPAGPLYLFTSNNDMHNPSLIPAFPTTQTSIAHPMHTCFGVPTPTKPTTVPMTMTTGLHKTMTLIFAHPAFDPPAPTTTPFLTLHHSDLDLQNIMVDDDVGTVVGIIDGDTAPASPPRASPCSRARTGSVPRTATSLPRRRRRTWSEIQSTIDSCTQSFCTKVRVVAV
ncbi:hypothetical protein NX059_009598 [Plenodomus lindquistii]|nr:hypothetical protein NX059_009598 [Plenodomus lindquistii]